MTDSILGPAIPQLPSGDLSVTETFFNSILGFQTIAKYPQNGFLIVKRGDAEIHFWQTPTEQQAKKLGSDSSCYNRVKQIEPIFKELKLKGASFRYELEEKAWGMNEMQIDDPFGNAIRFGEIIKTDSRA